MVYTHALGDMVVVGLLGRGKNHILLRHQLASVLCRVPLFGLSGKRAGQTDALKFGAETVSLSQPAPT